MSDAASLHTYALSILELLAHEAPADEIENLLHAALDASPNPEQSAYLERASQLGLEVLALFSQRQKREADMAALIDTARDLTYPHDLDSLLRVIIRQARRLLGFDMTYIALQDENGGGWHIRMSEGETADLHIGLQVEPGYGFGHALKRNAAFWTPDYLRDGRIQHTKRMDDVVRGEGQRAILAVPLHRGGTPFGGLYGSDRAVRHFSPHEAGLLRILADLAAVAIDKSWVLDQARADVDDLEDDAHQARLQVARMRGLLEAERRLIGLVLGSGDVSAVTVAASDALDSVLVVRDTSGQTITATGDIPDLDERSVARALLDAQAGNCPVAAENGVRIAPLQASGENLGSLFVHPREALTPEDEQLLQLVAQCLTITMLLQRRAVVVGGPVRDELLDDLLADPPSHSQRHLVDRAARLSIDLAEPHVVVVARPEGGEQGRAGVWAASYAHRLNGLKGVLSGCVVLLLSGNDASDAAKRVSAELSSLLSNPVTVAAAGPTRGATDAGRVYREAMRCLDVVTLLQGNGATAALDDLGFLGLLLSDDRDIDGFIDSILGPVLAYDSERLTGLARTLQAYFEADRSPTHAADVLHVHPNTVSRRLERITELLGPEWQKPQQALELQLALRLQQSRSALRTQGRTASQSDGDL
ncbi:GAF domain-containing protein [Streptomyces sp. CC224B]|uniref:GAF domain-containing protein n=1 Tax=Streptomyces sp. CC224B TaxID=3044571 RepID=UPI0024A8675D|nr:GAF domain-containing protein [Streptomyces sp. CC224B]